MFNQSRNMIHSAVVIEWRTQLTPNTTLHADAFDIIYRKKRNLELVYLKWYVFVCTLKMA